MGRKRRRAHKAAHCLLLGLADPHILCIISSQPQTSSAKSHNKVKWTPLAKAIMYFQSRHSTLSCPSLSTHILNLHTTGAMSYRDRMRAANYLSWTSSWVVQISNPDKRGWSTTSMMSIVPYICCSMWPLSKYQNALLAEWLRRCIQDFILAVSASQWIFRESSNLS